MSSDNQNLYKFYLVQFIVRGPQKKKKIDIVPYHWISLNEKSGKTVTKFMPAPYDEKRCLLLQNLVKNSGNPLNDWPEYNVIIKGGASKLSKFL